ncbi:MAG: hypothetical protein ABI379_01620 [Rhodanobacter sp.]
MTRTHQLFQGTDGMAEIDHLALFLLLAATLWLAVGFATAYMSGWRTLATYYRATEPFRGTRWRFSSASFRPLAYHQCLTLGANGRGLHVSVSFPFPFSHPPLFVPWSEVDSIEHWREAATPMVRLHLRRAPSVTFKISQDLARAMIKEVHGRTLPIGAGTLLDPGIRLHKATS